MIKFKEKAYSDHVISSTLDGLKIGTGIGTALAGILKSSKSTKDTNPFLVIGGGALVGAALGALAGKKKESDEKKARFRAGIRLFEVVIDNLKKIGFKEGRDFTQDPKMANILKTKVCIVVSRSQSGIKMLINTIDDPELREITTQIQGSLGRATITTEKANNKYNELSITTLSSSGNDSVFVAKIIESFIRRGYPVYIVEVG